MIKYIKLALFAISFAFILSLFICIEASAMPYEDLIDNSGRLVGKVVNAGGKKKVITHKKPPAPKKKAPAKKKQVVQKQKKTTPNKVAAPSSNKDKVTISKSELRNLVHTEVKRELDARDKVNFSGVVRSAKIGAEAGLAAGIVIGSITGPGIVPVAATFAIEGAIIGAGTELLK